MAQDIHGRILDGNKSRIRHACDKWSAQPVDLEIAPGGGDENPFQTTLKEPVSVTGPGTFFRRAQRTLTFEPSANRGWWFDRTDLPDSMPIRVSVNDVWTTARNIVLCTGSPHNYMRMVEHIIAMKAGMGLDNVVVRLDSGDPPLFESSSTDLVEAVDKAGIVNDADTATYLTVREPVTMGGRNGSFLTFRPAENGSRKMKIDCAIDFKSAIGRQRIRFEVDTGTFKHGASARTNTTLGKVIYCKTIGMIFADVRNLGYTMKNILVAGPRSYLNEPRLLHNGRSLEAVWHRAALDLLAAVALIDRGRFAGEIISYKAGHGLDVRMIRELYQRDLLVEM